MTTPSGDPTGGSPGGEAVFRWYAPPVEAGASLSLSPEPASWDRADHPAQVRLGAYLDEAERRVVVPPEGIWTLRLDVGLAEGRDLLTAADLDNYALPLAQRLTDHRLVSVWCTKRHSASSVITTAPAMSSAAPADLHCVRVTASTESAAYKQEVRAAVADQDELPYGPVALQISFGVGRSRNWLNLWKPTIDALDPLLGPTTEDRDWHPRDGRVVSLGLHVHHRADADHAVDVAIAACLV